MGISKKGLRKIVVDQQEFYWKFSKKLIVTSNEIKNCLLTVDFGWYDVWLYANDKGNKPPDFEPKNVTPKFVSESISYALSKGWSEGDMQIVYKDGDYKIKLKD